MSKTLTTDSLVNTSLRRALIPSDQSTFTNEDIIDILNEELSIQILPMVLKTHEEYYVVDEDIPLVACQSRYKIPYRAVGNKLRDIQFVNSSGDSFEMTRVSIEDRPSFSTGYTTSQLIPFYVQADEIVLIHKNSSSDGVLRVSYFLRPNELVEDERGAVITAICNCVCADTTIFTLCNIPKHFSSSTIFDFIQGTSPNKILKFDTKNVSISLLDSSITFNNSELKQIDLFSLTPININLNIGDYILKNEETIVPQLPQELRPILAQRVAVKLLEALGDSEGMKNAQQELDRMEQNSLSLIDNRVEGAPQKISNRHSILKNSLTDTMFRRRRL